MTYKENITAILECYFAGFKKEIIDSACNRILEQEPKIESKYCNCNTCVNSDEVDGSNCYECVKGMKNNYAPQEPIIGKIRAEIKEWYWKADKQALAKDPCVVDAMIDLFIRTIDKYKYKIESEVSDAHTD